MILSNKIPPKELKMSKILTIEQALTGENFEVIRQELAKLHRFGAFDPSFFKTVNTITFSEEVIKNLYDSGYLQVIDC
jgi:hypothetical protein